MLDNVKFVTGCKSVSNCHILANSDITDQHEQNYPPPKARL